MLIKWLRHAADSKPGSSYETGSGGRFPYKVSFWDVFGFRSGPDGSGHAVEFIWSLFRAKPSILDLFRAKFDVFGPEPTLWTRLAPPGPGWGRPLGVG